MATTVDVWIDTDTNRDGSPGICPTADGALTINSYVINLKATGGAVSYANFVNQRPAATTTLQPFNSDQTEMTVGRGGGQIDPPGTYKLMTVTITGLSGSPMIDIAAQSTLQVVDLTRFGSKCSGNDFDNTMKLGSDWFDTDGLGAFAPTNTPPVITAPSIVNGTRFNPVTVTGSASDPDGDLVTLTQSNNAPFFPQQTSSSGPSLNPSITLTGTPNFAQLGSYSVNWSALDTGTPALMSTASTAVTISQGVNGNPVITAPATKSFIENQPGSFSASATDPDANLVTLSQTTNATFLMGPTSVGPALNPSITLSGTPNFSQSGSFFVNWSAVDDATPAGTTTASTSITVGSNRNPVITAPSAVNGTEGSPI